MVINPNSKAAAVGSAVRNVQFQPESQVLQRKVLVVGTFDPAETGVVENTPVEVLSAADAGDRFGYGFMAHRLVDILMSAGSGFRVFVSPQAEASGAVAASGDIAFTGTSTAAGDIVVRIGSDLVSATVASGATNIEAAAALNAALTATTAAVRRLPVLSAVDGTDTFQVNLTAKSKGPWGNDITISVVSLPAGLTAAVTDMASGAGLPDINDSLNALGTGDSANEEHFTDLVHGYGLDATTLGSISTYVGEGNELDGLYSVTVARPFRAVTGDNTADTAGLTALIAITDVRKLDRANGVVAAPGSPTHPSEIAASAVGVMAGISGVRAEQSYIDMQLPGVVPGDIGDRWERPVYRQRHCR